MGVFTMFIQVIRLGETVLVGFLGGLLFVRIDFPLPWVLGAMSFIVLWQWISKREAVLPDVLKEGGFILLGINFGLSFTIETFQNVTIYFLPYLLITILLIAFSIYLGWLVSKWIPIDRITSMFACIPGGLMEMTLAAESLKGIPSLVAIFQTVRLIAVLFLVPSFMTFLFPNKGTAESVVETVSSGAPFSNWWLLFIPVLFAFLLKDKVPAGLIIGSLIGTALLNLTNLQLPGALPKGWISAAQIFVGISLGKNILIDDLKKAGRYGLVYFLLSLIIILGSFGLGLLLFIFTSMNIKTALLSIAPGGLFEMVLTAEAVGGDPAVVSALQLVRVLVIILFVPPVMKLLFQRKDMKSTSE